MALGAAALAAVVVGRYVGNGNAGRAVGLALFVPAALAVLARPSRGLLIGVAMVVLLPSNLTLGTPQANVTRLAAIAALGAVALDLRESSARWKLSRVDWAVAGILAMSAGSWALGAREPHSFRAALNYVLPLAFYVAGRRLGGRVGDQVLVTIFIASALAALTVLYEGFVAHRPLFADPNSYYWDETSSNIFRPGGVFGSPPTASTVLAMALLCGMPLLSRWHGLRRLCTWSAFVVIATALVLTFTRGAFIGVGVGVAVYALLLGPRVFARYVYTAIVVCVVVVAAVLPTVSATTWFQEGVLRQGTLASRESFWKEARFVITDSRGHELLGHGVNSLVVGRPDLPGEPQADIGQTDLTLHGTHDQYIRALVEGGVIGLALLLVWLLGTIAAGTRAAFAARRNRPVVAAATALCVAFAVTSLVGDTLREPQAFVLISLATGLLVSYAKRGRGADAEEVSES